MQRCPGCGKELPDEAAFCPYCLKNLCPEKKLPSAAVRGVRSKRPLYTAAAALALAAAAAVLLFVLPIGGFFAQSEPDGSEAAPSSLPASSALSAVTPPPESAAGSLLSAPAQSSVVSETVPSAAVVSEAAPSSTPTASAPSSAAPSSAASNVQTVSAVAVARTLGDFDALVRGYEAELLRYNGRIVEIPSQIDGFTVTALGDGLFENSIYPNQLTVVPDTVRTIGNRVFYGVGGHSVWSVVLSDSVESIGTDVMRSCDTLLRVVIGSGVASIGSGSFTECPMLNGLSVSAQNRHYSSLDGVLFDKEKTALLCYPDGKDDAVYTVPDGVTTLAAGVFGGNTYLTTVTIPASVTSIGSRAFGFDSLLTIAAPAGSYAAQYAADNGITLVLTDAPAS